MFSLQLRKILTSRPVRPLALLAIAALAAPGTALAASNWTAVGSTGAVDETCFHFVVQMNGPEAKLTPGLLFPCTLRYQVTDTNAGLTNKVLVAHISDATPTTLGSDQVVVKLIEYDRASGAVTTPPIISINSNTTTSTLISSAPFPFLRSYRSAVGCTGPTLDFVNKSYWIEVDLTPGPFPSLSSPAINMVGLEC